MAGQLTIDTLKASSGVLATQNGMTGIAKAWVNFNPSSGTVVINGSFNVGSVTRNAMGDYTVNFTTAMPNANYCSSFALANNALPGGASWTTPIYTNATVLTTSIRFFTLYQVGAGSSTTFDPYYVSATFVGS
jgi:hypothetical protein